MHHDDHRQDRKHKPRRPEVPRHQRKKKAEQVDERNRIVGKISRVPEREADSARVNQSRGAEPAKHPGQNRANIVVPDQGCTQDQDQYEIDRWYQRIASEFPVVGPKQLQKHIEHENRIQPSLTAKHQPRLTQHDHEKRENEENPEMSVRENVDKTGTECQRKSDRRRKQEGNELPCLGGNLSADQPFGLPRRVIDRFALSFHALQSAAPARRQPRYQARPSG